MGRDSGVTAPLKVPTYAGASQIQLFLLGATGSACWCVVERTTVFSVEQENVLELADATTWSGSATTACQVSTGLGWGGA